ncbi:hypothetical protein L083_5263 [Actinoplanes sp. N902-109]|nr:hypothetical protein L083_5263 [Actinoplanes sp. N902-109]
MPDQPRQAGRPELTGLLGRTVLETHVQRVCRDYALVPRSGTGGSGLSRAYLSRTAGVELAADTHGRVTTIVLHFTGDDEFTAFQGPIPGGAGSVPRRSRIWAMLGRPDETGSPRRDTCGPFDRWAFPAFTLHAQYAGDAERVDRITLSLPGHLPRAA